MSTNRKTVAVVTGSRADYGLLRPTIAALQEDPRFTLQLIVAAIHLHEEFGLTVLEVEADGFPIAARVDTGPAAATGVDFGRNVAAGVLGFTEALAELQPDLMLVLGDRHEILSAALAATGLGIPIAHLHGGELSEGSIDDSLRHSITKLSHLHFVAARDYAARVCQLGEDPARVHVVGAAGLEAIATLELLDRDALSEALGRIRLDDPVLAVTFHPASLNPEAAGAQAEEVVAGLEEAIGDGGTAIVTLPNDDLGNQLVRNVLEGWAERRPNVHSFRALGQLRYLSLLRHAGAVVGNSSSAIIEAPSFKVPVVNVGDRQQGRILAGNILSVPPQRDAIRSAVGRALDPEFRASLESLKSPYGDGKVSSRVLAVLAEAPPAPELRHKRFHDLTPAS